MRALLLLMLLLPAALHAQTPSLWLISPLYVEDGGFGYSVAGVPDANGDGYGDLLVGASEEDGGANNAGRAYLFSGATGALLRTLTSPNPEESGYFGWSVSGVPDADGDGRGDLLIGALWEDGGGVPAAGRAYLFSGATGALLRTLESPSPEGSFGGSVSWVPDGDGDGGPDLFIGAYSEHGGASGAGRAYLFSGATGTLLHTLTSPNPEPSGFFGRTVSGVPDADGDGRGDLLVGAFLEDGGGVESAGHAYLFSGATGTLLRPLTTPNPEPLGHFGHSVSGVPDADGDGRGDLLVGTDSESGGAHRSGRAYLFSGATGALLRTLTSPLPEPSGFFGRTVAGVPDADGDGHGDLVVGASQEDGGHADAGRVYVFSGATGAHLRTFISPIAELRGHFGSSVAGVPDVDGDGVPDLLTGALEEDVGRAEDAGRAYLFSGGTLVSAEPDHDAPALGLTVVPNPARSRAVLTVSLGEASTVRLSVHDVLGREVAMLVDAERAAGPHEATFDGSALPAGTYLVRLEAGGTVLTRPVTLVR